MYPAMCLATLVHYVLLVLAVKSAQFQIYEVTRSYSSHLFFCTVVWQNRNGYSRLFPLPISPLFLGGVWQFQSWQCLKRLHCEEGGLNTEVESHQAFFPEAIFGMFEFRLHNHIKGRLSATKHFRWFLSQLSQEKT